MVLRKKTGSFTWSILTVGLILFLSVPVFTILFHLFLGPGESWSHIIRFLLKDYIINTFVLVSICGLLSTLFGVASAWAVCRYELPFRKPLEWLLVLPLAVPNYLTAYAYAGIFDYGGPFDSFIKLFAGENGSTKIDIMNLWGLSIVLSASLYPYIYVAARSFFLKQSAAQISAAKMLGSGERAVFFNIALPLARPAIFGGLILVLMEVFNDYGASHYYGVSTFCTAIFRSWFALEEPKTAVYLAAMLCLMIFFIIELEKYQRRKKGYSSQGVATGQMTRLSTKGWKKALLTMLALLPVLLGFLFPVLQIIYWSLLTWKSVLGVAFFSLIGQSFALAALAALFCVITSVLLTYGRRWSRNELVKKLSKLATLGYAIPGVVIGVGLLIPTIFFDKWLIDFFASNFNISIGFIINGTVIGLLMAYLIRFLAVSFNPIESNVLRIGSTLSQAAMSLGAAKWRRMRTVELPLIWPGLVGGFLLVFVDVMKELPLTLLLKPYDVMTLSVKAYEYASDERIAEAALPSLVIILVGVMPVVFLNRLISK